MQRSTFGFYLFEKYFKNIHSWPTSKGFRGFGVLIMYLMNITWAIYPLILQLKGKHLILEKDPEKGAEYAFDNPGFKEPGLSPLTKIIEKPPSESSSKPKWTNWAPLSALTSKSEKKKTVDDSALGENEIKIVSLRSHDFTGLGFNICGNMRNGIFIKDVLQHGPASESGKLNPGDRITSVTINFEHMVYEDALTILSYASPYEVVIQATNGKLSSNNATTNQSARPVHPLYKSASSTDLLQIGRSAKKRLFQAEELNESIDSNYSSLQKTRSTATTLERSQNDSPVQKTPQKKPPKNALTPEQLKNQLERTILEDHKEALKNKQNFDKSQTQKVELETQKTDSSYQKFGIKVFPIENKEQKSPKIAELSQNDNNINIELSVPKESKSFDEVDKKTAPPVKKREKKPDPEEHFKRGGSLTGSGIKRDENGIPQEIPSHMYNAALAARRNRTSQENLEEKSLKKQKGKAPPPPENHFQVHQNLDEIYTESETPQIKTQEIIEDIPIIVSNNKTEIRYESDSDQETDNQSSVNTIELNSNDITIHQTEEGEDKQRRTASTGDLTKIQRIKTNTGTLERAQSLDITDTGIPTLGTKRKTQFEENFDSIGSSSDSFYQNTLINKEPRLSLILDGLNTFQRNRLKKSTEWGNLEDAILNLNKSDSSENCETGERMFDNESNDSFDRTTPELDALVNKIKEIKEETTKNIEEQEKEMRASWNEASETLTKAMESFKENPKREEELNKRENLDLSKNSSFVNDVLNAVNFNFDQNQERIQENIREKNQERNYEKNQEKNYEQNQEKNYEKNQEKNYEQIQGKNLEKIQDKNLEKNREENHERNLERNQEKNHDKNLEKNQEKNQDKNLERNQEKSFEKSPEKNLEKIQIKSKPTQSPIKSSNLTNASINLLMAEREHINKDYFQNNLEDTNVSDDIKVSRHSLSSEKSKLTEIPIKTHLKENVTHLKENVTHLKENVTHLKENVTHLKENVSNITISDKFSEKKNFEIFQPTSIKEKYKTDDKILVSTPDLIKNVSIAEAIHDLNEVTVEGPTSLTFEIKSPESKNDDLHFSSLSNGMLLKDDHNQSDKNSSLTYITEIQVVTPDNNKNISEIEVGKSKNLDNDFENFVKNFEAKTLENKSISTESIPELKSPIPFEKIDAEKELHKIQEIAEEQLKKLPEMRFSTSYEPKIPEKRQSQIELLRSNFEKSPPKITKPETPIKSRIPIATTKTPPTSPERRDSKNEFEMDKEIIEIMTSGKYQPKTSTKNVTVTSIRSSKIPSGLPTYSNRPPVPPRKSENQEGSSIIQLSTNGNTETSFKQWVFSPSSDNSVTNITVAENHQVEK